MQRHNGNSAWRSSTLQSKHHGLGVLTLNFTVATSCRRLNGNIQRHKLRKCKWRPIVSCRGYCGTPASRYIDFHIKSCMHSANSTLRDTSHVIRNLANKQGRLAADCYLITADVESIYTNMDWDDTIDALNVYLTECAHPLKELLLSLVRFVLCNNFFQYDEVLYHRERGMAMRTPMAINIANSFLFVH